VVPSGPPAHEESLYVGPARPPLVDRVGRTGRVRGALLAGLAVGVISGGAGTWWWLDPSPDEVRTASPPAAVAGGVRLVLTGVVARPPADRTSDSRPAPLLVDAVLVHGRTRGRATVTRIHRPGASLAIRAPALPVRLSVNNSSERIRLELRPRDCELAVRWTPSSRPFTVTWTDDRGDVHEDLGGDHEPPMELRMIRYLEAACEGSGAR
jgi:hypothetical protein